MRLCAFQLSWLLLLATGSCAQPLISPDGVLNAASYLPSGLPASGIAQGSMFVLFGKDLGPANLVMAGMPRPTELRGTSVRVSSGGSSAAAFLVYVSSGQLAAILPSEVPEGDGTVTVTYGGQTSTPAPIRVVRSAFGIFTRNQAGFGPAIVQNYVSPAEAPLNALNVAARAGQVEILWGTGLGPIKDNDGAAPPVGNVDVSVEVFVGGRSARLLYWGRSPQFPGVDQINFEVPAGVEGCHVPLAVKTGEVVSNYASLSVTSSDRLCSDATSYLSDEVNRAEEKNEARIGAVYLFRIDFMLAPFYPGVIRYGQGQAQFTRRDLNALRSSLGTLEGGKSVPLVSAPAGTCTVYIYRPSNETGDFTPLVGVPITGLKTGSTLNVTGPKGSKQLTISRGDGYFKSDLEGGFPGGPPIAPDYLEPGVYTVDNGSGGSDVGAFRGTLTIPAPLIWTNRESIQTVDRKQDLTVTWSGGDPANQLVLIGGESSRTELGVRGAFLCTERASAGRFTVPAMVLSSLPASSPWGGEGFPPLVMVGAVPAAEGSRLSAPGIDIGRFAYQMLTASLVTFR